MTKTMSETPRTLGSGNDAIKHSIFFLLFLGAFINNAISRNKKVGRQLTTNSGIAPNDIASLRKSWGSRRYSTSSWHIWGNWCIRYFSLYDELHPPVSLCLTTRKQGIESRKTSAEKMEVPKGPTLWLTKLVPPCGVFWQQKVRSADSRCLKSNSELFMHMYVYIYTCTMYTYICIQIWTT